MSCYDYKIIINGVKDNIKAIRITKVINAENGYAGDTLSVDTYDANGINCLKVKSGDIVKCKIIDDKKKTLLNCNIQCVFLTEKIYHRWWWRIKWYGWNYRIKIMKPLSLTGTNYLFNILTGASNLLKIKKSKKDIVVKKNKV